MSNSIVRLSLYVLCTLLLGDVCGAADSPGLFVAVGYGGRRISSRDGLHWENDQRWSDVAADDDNALFNIAWGLGVYVAVGGGAKIGHIVVTKNGKEWNELPQWKGRVATIVFARDRFVAAHDGELLWSTDGEVFHPGQKLGFKGSVHARRSACGDTEAGYMTLVVGDVDLWDEKARVGWRASSTDGETWASQTLETPEVRDVAYGAGHFVVVGPHGLLEQSHDAQNWTRCEIPGDEDFQSIIWTGSRFVVKGRKTWISPDGLTWQSEARVLPCRPAWGSEKTGGVGTAWGGNLFFSMDFLDWKKVVVPAGPSFTAVAWGE